MQAIGAPTIGLTATSVWKYGPNVKQFRPNVEDAKVYLEDVKYTPGDISQMSFDQNVPNYTPQTLSPKIPDITVKENFQPTIIPVPTSRPASMTAHMMSKAIGLKTYQAVS